MALVHIVFGLLFLNISLTLASGANPDNPDYKLIADISSICYSLANLFWVFTIRNRLHQMTKAGEQSLFWINGILTFLFQSIYLQYKVNEYLDNLNTDTQFRF